MALPATEPGLATGRPGDEGRADAAAVARFLAAGAVDHEAWHDGTGYPLDQLGPMNPATREQLVDRLPVHGWREVDVLAELDTPKARAALRAGFESAGCSRLDVGLAILRRMPDCLSEPERTALIIEALEKARGADGLDAALEAARQWHPAPVMQALWQALEAPDRTVVVHVAALLYHLHGLSPDPFDLSRRSQFLQFAADVPHEPEAARAHLRTLIGGADPAARTEHVP